MANVVVIFAHASAVRLAVQRRDRLAHPSVLTVVGAGLLVAATNRPLERPAPRSYQRVTV